ncbi:MAG: hypothetical protein M1835_005048 [Candelina submexicana]|nr:MAG: hypothetical protein M1835_005048 [Candelina submexicana]
MATDEEEYFVPLQDQRVFGSGIKRKRVQFVPGASDTSFIEPPQKSTNPKAIGDHYLSIVISKAKRASAASSQQDPELTPSAPVCEICNLPLPTINEPSAPTTRPHESSLAHQICLTHSYPPSHLDRARPGLKYLSSYGWDPDSRLGLGATGDGIRIPIKGKAKNDTVGLGIDMKKLKKRGDGVRAKEEKLNAKEVRRTEDQGRKRREKLQEMFYQSEDIEKYLGLGG